MGHQLVVLFVKEDKYKIVRELEVFLHELFSNENIILEGYNGGTEWFCSNIYDDVLTQVKIYGCQ